MTDCSCAHGLGCTHTATPLSAATVAASELVAAAVAMTMLVAMVEKVPHGPKESFVEKDKYIYVSHRKDQELL